MRPHLPIPCGHDALGKHARGPLALIGFGKSNRSAIRQCAGLRGAYTMCVCGTTLTSGCRTGTPTMNPHAGTWRSNNITPPGRPSHTPLDSHPPLHPTALEGCRPVLPGSDDERRHRPPSAAFAQRETTLTPCAPQTTSPTSCAVVGSPDINFCRTDHRQLADNLSDRLHRRHEENQLR